MDQIPTSPAADSATPPPAPPVAADADFDTWIETQEKPAPAAVAEPPAAVETETPAPVVADAAPAPVAADAEEPEPDPASEAGKTLAKHKRSLQSRIDQEVGKRGAAERERDALKAEIEALKSGRVPAPAEPVAPTPAAAAPPAPPANDPEPKLADFESAEDPYMALVAATARWNARQEHRTLEAKKADTLAADRARIDAEAAARQAEASVAEHLSRLDAFRQTHPDFDAVLANPQAKTTPVMNREMGLSAAGAVMAYYLGTHPEESVRIASLQTEREQVFAMGQLAARLDVAPSGPTPATVSTSQTPPPIKPVGAASTQSSRDPSKMSTDEHIEWANKEDARRRG